ncbi:unnamed protein product [Microthlaspi erraticum]|uniref:BTB domain-containing protein n=1 Tax=Microthlaspi erraticum TaxID=1685480 RepID=A0A6D2L9P0_9BRAS|nr:unnamed protein product [Microthlaspi erraticum]
MNNVSNSDSSIDMAIRCNSCQDVCLPHHVGTCKKCYDEVREAMEELMEENNVLKAKVDFLRLSSSLDHGSSSRSFPDVVLFADSVDGVSRSRVFKAMLENEMEESYTGIVRISDVSYDVLRTFVSFLYTAEVCLDDYLACQLLVMSDKFEVKHLNDCCEKYLVTKLTPENSFMAYVFAHQHNAKQLSDAALTHIIDNMDMVIKTEEYMEIKKRDPHFVLDIYDAYTLKQVKNAARAQNYFSEESTSSSRPPTETNFQCWLTGDRFLQLLRKEL